MGRFRIDYADVVARARPSENVRRVAAAIERLSAAWRAGRDDFSWDDPSSRAAYLWHLVPAHVCDAARIAALRIGVFDRPEVDLVSLGAGPGSEVLGCLEAITAAKAAGGLTALRTLRVRRIDRVGRWEEDVRALSAAAREAYAARCPDLGTAWTIDDAAPLVVMDLLRPLETAVPHADLVLAFNLVSELAPRADPALPAGASAGLVPFFREALAGGAEVWVADRAGAPHVPPRFAALRGALEAMLPLSVDGPRERLTRCACAFSRRARSLYRHVHLPTTNDEDGPVRNCRTLWMGMRRTATE